MASLTESRIIEETLGTHNLVQRVLNKSKIDMVDEVDDCNQALLSLITDHSAEFTRMID